MAGKTRKKITTVTASEVKGRLAEILRQAGKEEIVVTVRGRPAAVIIGFEDEADWLEYRLLKDEDFQSRIAESRRQFAAGKYKSIDELS